MPFLEKGLPAEQNARLILIMSESAAIGAGKSEATFRSSGIV